MWKKIEFNKQNIKAETGRAVLINCPHKSYYDGYSFWVPASLVREGSHSYAYTLSYTEDFVFTLKKYGKGKYNSRDVIDEVQIVGDDIADIFDGIPCGKKQVEYNPYETHKPEKLEAEETEALAELIDE